MTYKSIGEQIAYYRQEKKMTQSELAEILCVSRSVVAHWERGDQIPSLVVFFKLCEVFDVSTDTFLAQCENNSNNEVGGSKAKKAIIITLCLTLLLVLFFIAVSVGKGAPRGEIIESTPDPSTGVTTKTLVQSMEDLVFQTLEDEAIRSFYLKDLIKEDGGEIGLFLLTD